MLVDHASALRWASASDQVAAPVSAGQERLARAWPRSASMYSSFSTRPKGSGWCIEERTPR
jgi:hypothetical protein